MTILAAGCAQDNAAPPEAPPVPVLVAVVQQKAVPVQLQSIGRVEPKETVAIKARVGGQIVAVRPGKAEKSQELEGQDVEAGEVLFQIDPQPFLAPLEQAKANLVRDEATLENANAELKRAQKLRETNAVTQEVFEQLSTRVRALEAAKRADAAAIDAADVQLKLCTIRSPIAGRAGALLVRFGNVVKADDANPLVVINQLSPIYAVFTAPEQELPRIRRLHREADAAKKKLHVRATPIGEKVPLEGDLTFIDNQVDVTTGTIELRALFRNDERRLWPGQFVDVELRLSSLEGSIIVPNEAIQTGQKEQYVFVIKPDDTAEYRPIVQGIQVGTETVIASGLQRGERVVVDGQLRLANGVRVAVKATADGAKGTKP